MAGQAIWFIGIGIGVLALVMLSRQAEAAPPETYILDVYDISTAENLEKLDTYLELANELYVTGEISEVKYNLFYETYRTRYEELIGDTG